MVFGKYIIKLLLKSKMIIMNINIKKNNLYF